MKSLVIFVVMIMLFIPVVYSKEVSIPGVFETEKVVSSGETTYFYAGSKLVASQNEDIITYHYQDRMGSDVNSKSLPFGQSIKKDERFSFTGKELDSELHYFNARYYDSNLGRFTSVDPIPGELAYSYVMNNPVMYVDPDGREIKFTNSGGESQRSYGYAKDLIGAAAKEHGGNYQLILNSLNDLEQRKDVVVNIIDLKKRERNWFNELLGWGEAFEVIGVGYSMGVMDAHLAFTLDHFYEGNSDHRSINSAYRSDSNNPSIIMGEENNREISEALGISSASSLIHEIGHVLYDWGYFDDGFNNKESDLWMNGDGIFTVGPRFGFNPEETNEIIPIYLENTVRLLEGLDFDQLRISHQDMGF
jgi:RHS repeat-associated protein